MHSARKPKAYRGVALLTALCLFFFGMVSDGLTWCKWGVVKGQNLGYIGDGSRGYAIATTARGTTTLNTQIDRKAIFFGYVGNEITIKRDGRLVAHCGDYRLEPKESGGYTTRNAIDGSVTYQPGWLLMQSPIVTRVYACQPHGKGHFRMAGGQGAMWSTESKPVVNEVRPYSSSEVEWTATGYAVFNNENFVSLIEMDELWPCEMIADFATPAGFMAIRTDPDCPDGSNRSAVEVNWDARWPCNYSAGDTPISEDNILFTISGEVSPPGSGEIKGLGKYHSGRTAQVTAQAKNGYGFSHWGGGYRGGPSTMGILVENNIKLVAVFKRNRAEAEFNISATGGNDGQSLAWAEASIYSDGVLVAGPKMVKSGPRAGADARVEKLTAQVETGSKVWVEIKGGAEDVEGEPAEYIAEGPNGRIGPTTSTVYFGRVGEQVADNEGGTTPGRLNLGTWRVVALDKGQEPPETWSRQKR